jgi:very-short-patch-repair endonuclease
MLSQIKNDLNMHYKQILFYAREMRKNPTKAEAFFWERVRNRKFIGLKFNRQFIVEYRDDNGCKSFYIVDFYCHAKNLIIEIDGGIHLEHREFDALREEDLVFLGYQVVRFTNMEVLDHWNDIVMPKLMDLTHPQPLS